jgi:uncharacterized protein YjlB
MAKPGGEADPTITRDQAPSATTANGTLSAAAAAADTVIADTGALAAGDYEVEIACAVLGVGVAGVGLVAQHRNAANSADISTLGGCAGGDSTCIRVKRVTIAASERIRVKVDAVALPATTKALASVRAYKLP